MNLAVLAVEKEGGLGVDGGAAGLNAGAAVVHAEFAVGRGIEDVGRIGEDGEIHPHQAQHALHFPVVADAVAVETAVHVDGGAFLAFLAGPQVGQHALEHVVVAGDVAADEGRGVGEGHAEVFREGTLLLGRLDEGVQVVTDHLGHAGGGDGDHLRLVQRVGVGQAVDNVVQATKNGRVFRHGVGNAGAGLLEVAVEVGTEVGDAALGTMHVGQGAFKAGSAQDGAQGLAGLGRIDGQGFALEVDLPVFPGLGVSLDFLHLGCVGTVFELLLAGHQVLVFGLLEQLVVVEHFLSGLRHFESPFYAPGGHPRIRRASSFRLP